MQSDPQQLARRWGSPRRTGFPPIRFGRYDGPPTPTLSDVAEPILGDDQWRNLDEYIKWHDRLRDAPDSERELVRFIEELHRYAVVLPNTSIATALANVRSKLANGGNSPPPSNASAG